MDESWELKNIYIPGYRTGKEEAVSKIRFSDEWIGKVESWAEDHAAMIKRYDALLLYRKMQCLAQELTGWEMNQFNSLEGSISEMQSDEWPGDDIDSEDWTE